MRSEERRGKERSQAEQLNWERDCDERECIWREKKKKKKKMKTGGSSFDSCFFLLESTDLNKY